MAELRPLLSHQARSAKLYTTVSDMFPNSAVASVSELGGLGDAVGGMLLPLFGGRLLDRYQTAGNEGGGYTHLLVICAFRYLATFLVHHLLAPRFERFTLGDR